MGCDWLIIRNLFAWYRLSLCFQQTRKQRVEHGQIEIAKTDSSAAFSAAYLGCPRRAHFPVPMARPFYSESAVGPTFGLPRSLN